MQSSSDSNYNQSKEINTTQISPSGINYSFDSGIAVQVGIEEAILYNHIKFWIIQNMASGRNLYEDRTWMYDSIEDMLPHFPFFTYDKLKRCLHNLVVKGLVLRNNFNKNKFDKTPWYALSDESGIKKILTMRQNCPVDEAKKPIDGAKNPHRQGHSAPSSYIQIEDQIKEPTQTALSVSVGSHVKIKKEAYDKLCEEHTKPVIDSLIEEMNTTTAQPPSLAVIKTTQRPSDNGLEIERTTLKLPQIAILIR